MKRIFDLFLSLCLIPVLLLPILAVAVLVRLTSKGPALYWSNRVGNRRQRSVVGGQGTANRTLDD